MIFALSKNLKNYKKVRNADNYISPKKYVIFERAKCFKQDQQAGETV